MAVRVVCFPSGDRGFRACVDRALRVESVASGARDRCEAVERRVRASYPACTVRPRHELAALTHVDDHVWYAYRDGALCPSATSPDREPMTAST